MEKPSRFPTRLHQISALEVFIVNQRVAVVGVGGVFFDVEFE